uniref:Uncharacterized protein n=1 Tax=Nelumbo nucifera TaxID=4432 RepID=A0A822XTI9_NELNU|nr:TPA_asm: hypothetical protein HUJ06_023872 [Nelumbo nucifera]
MELEKMELEKMELTRWLTKSEKNVDSLMIEQNERSVQLKEQLAKHVEDIRATEVKLVNLLTLDYGINFLVIDAVSLGMAMEVHNELDSRGDEVSMEDDIEENGNEDGDEGGKGGKGAKSLREHGKNGAQSLHRASSQ